MRLHNMTMAGESPVDIGQHLGAHVRFSAQFNAHPPQDLWHCTAHTARGQLRLEVQGDGLLVFAEQLGNRIPFNIQYGLADSEAVIRNMADQIICRRVADDDDSLLPHEHPLRCHYGAVLIVQCGHELCRRCNSHAMARMGIYDADQVMMPGGALGNMAQLVNTAAQMTETRTYEAVFLVHSAVCEFTRRYARDHATGLMIQTAGTLASRHLPHGEVLKIVTVSDTGMPELINRFR